jgi:hypothetical protein
MSATTSERLAERHETSPQVYARVCGALYLYIGVAGMFAELFVRSKLVVPGDAAATTANIAANELLFRIGFSGELLHLTFDVMVAVLLYVLLRPVDRTLALMAAFFRSASDVILAVASISHFAALRLLGGADYLATFPPEQLQTLALLALELHGDGYSICLAFFGFACLALGRLIYGSTYLPKTLGVLMAIAGSCYLVNSFAVFLAPAIANKLFPVLFAPILIAEMGLALWLLIKGVDLAKWQAVSAAPRRSG